MTEREAIEMLSEMRDSHYVIYSGIKMAIFNSKAIDVFNFAISALEKQIPLKPKEEPDRSPLHNKRCPSCNKILTVYDWQMPYCKMCGRAIDWG